MTTPEETTAEEERRSESELPRAPTTPDAGAVAPLPTPAPEDDLVGSVIAERYLVHGLLGRGGMGAVYEAEHIHMKKRVALKILHGEMTVNSEVVARFEREAVAAGRIQHPSVVTATDFGRLPSGAFYLVLELVDGQSLAEVLKAEAPLEASRVFRILVQINAALVAAHEAGIVHRDLKPDNIMLVGTGDEEDFVKVLDFGIAKLHVEGGGEGEKSLTRAGVVFGTPEYMSPEQARGDVVDARSDLYALGMIGYEMFAGRSAFHSDDLMAVLTAQITDPPPPLPESVPAPFAALLGRLLEKSPEDRPADAARVAEELFALAEELGYSLPMPRTSAGTRLDVTGVGSKRSSPELLTQPSTASKRPGGMWSSFRALSMRPVPLGRHRIPLWIPVVGLTAGAVLGSWAMVRFGGWREARDTGATTQRSAAEREEQLLSEARGGDREALAELRGIVDAERARSERDETQPSPRARAEDAVRDAARYMALGRGYSAIRHYSAALQAYQSAVLLDPHAAEDAELLLDVRVALEQRDAVEDGLDLAQKYLGAPGADLIYDIWRDHLGQPGMTPVVARAQKLVRDKALREQATPALRVALDLERAKTCADYRELVPVAVRDADDRSLMKLEALQSKRGCGPGATKDCFPCLRVPEVPLEEAIERARSRKSPEFVRPIGDRKKR